MSNLIHHDGRFLYVDVDDVDPETMMEAIARTVNYAKAEGITLVPTGVHVRDNVGGSYTLRFQVKSVD